MPFTAHLRMIRRHSSDRPSMRALSLLGEERSTAKIEIENGPVRSSGATPLLTSSSCCRYYSHGGKLLHPDSSIVGSSPHLPKGSGRSPIPADK
jgi:hypothetical protein